MLRLVHGAWSSPGRRPGTSAQVLMPLVFGRPRGAGSGLGARHLALGPCRPPPPRRESCRSAVRGIFAARRKPAATGRRRGRKGLGQAGKLPGAAWASWTGHVEATSPSWLYPAVCLRVTEVLSARGKDAFLEEGTVQARASKRQSPTDKCPSETAASFVRKLQ